MVKLITQCRQRRAPQDNVGRIRDGTRWLSLKALHKLITRTDQIDARVFGSAATLTAGKAAEQIGPLVAGSTFGRGDSPPINGPPLTRLSQKSFPHRPVSRGQRIAAAQTPTAELRWILPQTLPMTVNPS